MSAHGGMWWIRYGKGIRALRFEGPNSYRPLDLHVVPRSLSIRNVKEFLHISDNVKCDTSHFTFRKCEGISFTFPIVILLSFEDHAIQGGV